LTQGRLLVTFPSVSLLGLLQTFALLVVVGCAAYAIVSYTAAFGPAGSRRPPRVLRTALLEFAATLALMPLWPLWLVLGASYRAQHEGTGHAFGRSHPVVLFHGLALNRTSWFILAPRLVRRGIGPLYGTTYFSPQSVRRSAEHLRRFVDEVRAREQAERVDIVAHSLGGVVARYYIERLGGAAHVGRLVTIGSPHKGTRLARLGLVGSARELHTDSPLYAELGWHDGVKYSSVWSRADAVVVPPESAAVAPVGHDSVFDDLGHVALLFSTRVVDAVAERLSA
jgi:triacylglycerol esterase/lipase EstA (alpha/beta hydrolase family)